MAQKLHRKGIKEVRSVGKGIRRERGRREESSSAFSIPRARGKKNRMTP